MTRLAAIESAAEPRLPKPCSLNFQGDWGQANFHRILSWLCQEFVDRARGSKIAIWNGRGGTDAVLAVTGGQMDLAIATPARFSTMATEGRGPFRDNRQPGLRALAVLPQRDRLVFAIDGSFGISSIEDLKQRKPRLKIAASSDDGESNIGYATQRLLEASGLGQNVLEGWGCTFWEAERPDDCLAAATNGEVDAVIQEAIMTPWWLELLRRREMRFLSWEQEALRKVEKEFGWKAAIVERSFLPGLEQDIQALDFSDFILLVNESMDDQVAHLLTWCLCERRQGLEKLYHHIPSERSPLGYPFDLKKMADAPIPLHPGAKRYYTKAGILA